MKESVKPAGVEFARKVAAMRCYEDVRWNGRCFAPIVGVLAPVLVALAQDVTPTPQSADHRSLQWWRLSSPAQHSYCRRSRAQPVDIYRKVDIVRLAVRSATDFVQKLPAASGLSINDNLNTIGDGRTEIDLRGLYSKETLVLQDGRRLATDGFAGYEVGLNFFYSPTVDLNLFPLGLIDHIDILKDGASAIYGSDAVGGVLTSG